MKCLWPSFSAATGVQSMRRGLRVDLLAVAAVDGDRPPGVSTASSPSSRKTTSRVCSSSAGTSRGDEVLALRRGRPPSARRSWRPRSRRAGSRRHHRHRVGALHLRERRAHRLGEVAPRRRRSSSAMRCAKTSVSVSDEKTCPLGGERAPCSARWFSMMPLCTTATPAVGVRVRVLVGRPAVGGPAGVADARWCRSGGSAASGLEVAQLARGAHHVEGRPAVDHRHAGGVIAAVLELPQPATDEVTHCLGPT